MNIMKQDAMDDKIIERCKNMWKTMHARGSWQIEKLSSSYRAEANLNGSNNYWVDKKFLDGLRICREAIETNSRKLRWIEIALTSVEKGRSKISMDSYLSISYQNVQK